MAKKDEVMVSLEQENKLLKEKLAAQESINAEMVNVLGGDIANEMKKIRQKGRSSANSITIVEQSDHKNIMLWTPWGKQLGPMHPENAIQTLNTFADMGIILSSEAPTEAKANAWYASKQGQEMVKKEKLRRARKMKSLRSGRVEQLTEAIAKMAGVKAGDLTNILSPDEVGK